MLRFAYRWLLRLHPRYFRQRFAEEMLWIFDEAEGNLEAVELVTDGVVSLVRQWTLRRAFWKEPVGGRNCDGVPIFCSFDTFKPRSSALIQGIALSIVMFWAACWAVRYSWNRSANVAIRGIEYENHAHNLAPGSHATASGYRGALTNSREPAISSRAETATAKGSLSSPPTLLRRGIPQLGSLSHSARTSFSATSLSAAAPSDIAQASKSATPLPHPSGKYGVASIGFDWIDSARPENHAHDSDVRRELMVYVWYPTGHSSRPSALSEYLPHADAIARAEKGQSTREMEESWGSSWSRIFSNQVVTDTHEGAPIASGNERFPLLMFSPGYGVPSTIYTTLLQEVVSHGYVVASIEPPYDVAASAFPDGRVVLFRRDKEQPGEPAPPGETRNEFLNRIRRFEASHGEPRVADIQFVIEQMENLDKSTKESVPFAGRIDFDSLGAWGHSIGGTAAGMGCQLDTRIKACLSEDGGGVPEGACLGQPFMHIAIYHQPATDEQLAVHKVSRKEWEKDHQARLAASERRLRACSGRRYEVTIKIPGADHYSFTDWPLLDAENKKDVDAALHALKAIEAYTIAFFDSHLKHQSETLLDDPRPPSDGVTLKKEGKSQAPSAPTTPCP
jgi:predicted dienelactone hydrolase